MLRFSPTHSNTILPGFSPSAILLLLLKKYHYFGLLATPFGPGITFRTFYWTSKVLPFVVHKKLFIATVLRVELQWCDPLGSSQMTTTVSKESPFFSLFMMLSWCKLVYNFRKLKISELQKMSYAGLRFLISIQFVNSTHISICLQNNNKLYSLW